MSDDLGEGVSAADLVERLAASKYEHLSEPAVDRAKMCLLDWVGLAVRGSTEELAQILQIVALSESGSGVVPILGTSYRTTEMFAALVNGAQGHAIDFDDTHEPSLVHVSASLWPAILAAAYLRQCSGKEVIAAFAAGVDAQAELGRGVGAELTSRGFHATSVIGRIGAAVALSNLESLSHDAAETAVGIAATQSGGLAASFGTMSKPFHPGKAAMDALLAVRLAEHGFTGPNDAVEGRGGLFPTLLGRTPRSVVTYHGGFGDNLFEVSIKPYPSCLLTHPSIDAALELSSKVDPAGISSILCRVNPLVLEVAGNPVPASPLEGKFSVQYCVAAALVGQGVSDRDFTSGRLGEVRASGLMEKTRVVPDDSLSVVQAVVEIDSARGNHLSHRTEAAKGNPANPVSLGECLSKFDDLVEPVLGASRCKSLAGMCLEAETLMDFKMVMDGASK